MIIINNKTYSGNNIIVSNNKVIINGEDVTPDSKKIDIKVEGNIDKLNVDACNTVEVIGNVTDLKTQSGDVKVKDLKQLIEEFYANKIL